LHPITVIEIVTSVGFVLVIFVIALVSPTRIRKLGLIVASILTLLLLLSFAIRPVWIPPEGKSPEEGTHSEMNH
jgi:hypothetical protein